MVNQACHEACLSRVRGAGEAEGSLPTSSCLPVVSGLPAVAGHSYENCRVYTNNSHSGTQRSFTPSKAGAAMIFHESPITNHKSRACRFISERSTIASLPIEEGTRHGHR